MPVLPTGTVTFLFADIEGSTALVQRLGDQRYANVLGEYRRLSRQAIGSHSGTEVDTEGDGYFAVFSRARDALDAAIAMQRAFSSGPWPEGVVLRVRIGMHTGAPLATGTGYVGVDVHRAARISAAAWGGQVLLSQSTEALVGQSLSAGVSLRPLGAHRLKDLQQAEQLFQVVHPDLFQGFGPLRSLSVLPNNLPLQLTSFIGRERENAEVKRLLAAHRLVTLTGIGGVGKTRLALQVAAEVLELFPDGVWLVELEALSDAALVPQAVASALGVREEPGRALMETLLIALRSRTLLLMLDNCEHLIEACARFGHAVLRDCPGVRILATSREPLRVPGEVITPVPPLSLPDPRHVPPVEQLADFEAIRLFVERSVIARPQFTLTPENGLAAAQIVHRLGGVPLAIELAAARLKALSPSEVSARLDNAFRLLTGGARTVLPRHQTLQATIDWSHDLLSGDERTVLRRVAVFRGSFSLEAAVAVCGEGLERHVVLDLLGSLAEKSLLLIDVHGEVSRYRMLEIMRQYGRAKAEEFGEWPSVLNQHLAFFLGMAKQATAEMRGLHEQQWLERLELDHDNLGAALEWAHAGRQTEHLLELASSLERFWFVRGYWSEGRQWLEVALAASAPQVLRARALSALASLAYSQADYDRAGEFCELGLAAYRELGDHQGTAKSLGTLGNIAYQRGDYATAWAHHTESLASARLAGARYEAAAALLNLAIVADHQGEFARATALCRESLQLFREENEMRGAAGALNLLGVLAGDQGESQRADEYFKESLAIHRQIGDKRGIAAGLSSLAHVARARRDFATAQTLYGQSLELRRELGHMAGVAESLSNMGLAALGSGNMPQATAFFQESLKLRQSLGDKAGIARCLEGLARVAPAPTAAVRLLGAASKLREGLGHPVPPSDVAEHKRYLNALQGALDATFWQVWNEARETPLEQVVSDALGIKPDQPERPQATKPST